MKKNIISRFFIDRPIFATVLSIIITVLGGISLFQLPVKQYPEVAPPTIQVIASYPGANAETIAKTVATPLEQEINGVDNMLYMTSQSSSDGSVRITVAFKLGTNLDTAQVLVQNRVALAESKLPNVVSRLGVSTIKSTPEEIMVITLISPNKSYDTDFLANYGILQIRDRLSRIDGVGSLNFIGGTEYSMRIWLDPDKIESLNLSSSDVVRALRAQNSQVSSGSLNEKTNGEQHAFEVNIQTQGKLENAEEFSNVIVKSSSDGRLIRIKDIGRVELGLASYRTKGYVGNELVSFFQVLQRPGTNALETAKEVREAMKELSKDFPKDLEYRIPYNPSAFIAESIQELAFTIFEAICLVVLVIILFLQSWRAAIIPILAIPVSLIGTFALMSLLGFSINNLSLFGIVLSVGIVVDDAIIVVENMQRYLENGLGPIDAAKKTMDEVGSALVSMGLVLVAVFVPTAFLGGISGQFYQQFGLTIAAATLISVFVSLTLSPAMATFLLKPKKELNKDIRLSNNPFLAFSNMFNKFMARVADQYGKAVQKVLRLGTGVLIIYTGLVSLTAFEFNRVPTGFVPIQDVGYMVALIQLPPGSSLSRTEEVTLKAINKMLNVDGVETSVAFAGFDLASFSGISHSGGLFPVLEDFEVRKKKGLTYEKILSRMQTEMESIKEANIIVIRPPAVRGMGNSSGFRMMVQDRGGLGFEELKKASDLLVNAANRDPRLRNVFTFFNTNTPSIYFDIDRNKASKLGVPISEISQSLEAFLGSVYINDFNYLGRNYQVTAQADALFRSSPDDISRIKVRSLNGNMIPLGSIGTLKNTSGPSLVTRYNLFTATSIVGSQAEGYSSDDALTAMEELAQEILPPGISFEWTEIAYQERESGGTSGKAFILAVFFVFLLLAAQYESWVLPIAVIFIVPMVLLSAIVGIDIVGLDNSIIVQIGLVVLVGLASKNAILIVEFAKQLEDEGKSTWEATTTAAKLRLRPILMTSLAFILGVVPLVFAYGAAAEMRRALGVTVFSGMVGVTIFGLVFTPAFYFLSSKLLRNH